MDFYTYTTMRDWAKRTTPEDRLSNEIDAFYGKALHDAYQMQSGQFMGQMLNERDWEKATATLLQCLARHCANADEAESRSRFQPDSTAAACPLHSVSQGRTRNPLTFDWKGAKFRFALS